MTGGSLILDGANGFVIDASLDQNAKIIAKNNQVGKYISSPFANMTFGQLSMTPGTEVSIADGDGTGTIISLGQAARTTSKGAWTLAGTIDAGNSVIAFNND